MNLTKVDYIAIILVAFIAVTFFLFKDSLVQKEASLTSSDAPRFIVRLEPQNDFQEKGIATLSEVDGKVRVAFDLENVPVLDRPQPAHIHKGSCENLGPVKYTLTFPKNGYSETTLSVSMKELLNELPLAINVHKSIPESTQYAACGDIQYVQ